MSYLHVQRIAAIRDEFSATRAALDYAQTQEARYADISEFEGVKVRFVTQARFNLEGTYLIRIFAEFETILRDYRQSLRPGRRPTRIDVERLVDGVATRLRITPLDRDNVHDVRRYRNALVHAGGGAQIANFSGSFRFLCMFLSWLP